MGRGSATVFHPHCVIYNITDTTTPKFTLRVSSEREKKKALSFHQGKNNERIINKEHVSLLHSPSLSQ